MASKKTIIFLYFHGLHQLYHSVTTAIELSLQNKNIRILMLSCNKEHTSALQKVRDNYPDAKVEIIELKQPFRYTYLNFKRKSYPSVNAMVRRSKKIVQNADAVVTTSHGLAKMFKKFEISNPKLIIMKHGCGDREYSFDPVYGDFDLVLIGGNYHYKIMLEKSIVSPERLKIIGYPKFDLPQEKNSVRNIFRNDKPIVLYNPHWEPEFTSYTIYEQFILDYFKNNKNFNLIFSPHILLKHWKTRYHYNLNFDAYKNDLIHIDFGSQASIDNSYIKMADIYIGDVSSLVYEFIALKPRSCIFLNAHNIKWENNLYYRFWELGHVVNNRIDFDRILKSATANNSFEKLQNLRIKEYIDIKEISSSKRAAQVISDFVFKKAV